MIPLVPTRMPAVHLRPIATLAVLLLLSACGKEAAEAKSGAGERPIPVTTQIVQPRVFQDALAAIGTAKARESVTVTAKVSETVQGVHFDSGDAVAKGAPLVTLSGQAQQAGLVEAQAAVDESERLYERQRELAAQQLIASSQLDTQRATRDAARARVAQIRAQLGDRVIRAPFAGVLGLRQVSPGALVTPGTAIATLDDLSRVYVDFPVPERALASVAPGQQVGGRSAAYPDRRFEGTVTTIDARVDPATRAVTVRADFPNPQRELRPGMLVNVELRQPERKALLVPEIAIVQVGQKTFVYRVKADGSVEQAEVAIGTRRDGLAEIASGLAPGERIVVDGTGKLRPGLKVVDTAIAAPVAADAPKLDKG